MANLATLNNIGNFGSFFKANLSTLATLNNVGYFGYFEKKFTFKKPFKNPKDFQLFVQYS